VNIAWGTAAILALLLPGFFFLRGLGLAEPFSRDATPRSPIALLAVAVLVSLLAHAAGLTVLRWLGWLQPDIGAILLIASGQLTTDEHLVRVTKAVANYPGAIASYFGLVSLLSLLAAWGLGALAIRSPRLGRMFYEHEWLHGFDGKTRPALVYAVTNVEFGDSLLMYHGQLDRFGIKQDGRFSFIVLKDARRAVLPRHDDKEKISWRQVQPKLASGALGLTRLRGHLPKGGYDVQHGQERWAPHAASVQ
jgi:hypothetical protein